MKNGFFDMPHGYIVGAEVLAGSFLLVGGLVGLYCVCAAIYKCSTRGQQENIDTRSDYEEITTNPYIIGGDKI